MTEAGVSNGVVLVVGMTRSGTTLTTQLLSLHPDVHVELEPQMLWKSGSFRHLADDRFASDRRSVAWIREQLLRRAGGRVLVEKSPSNSVRAGLVHLVFPEARVVHVERDPVRCVYANYLKSRAGIALDPKVVVGKYLRPTTTRARRVAAARNPARHIAPRATRSVFDQIRGSDWPAFVAYTARLLWLRNMRHRLPFGPKITGFAGIIAHEGLLAYHAQALAASHREVAAFSRYYGDRLSRFSLEQLVADAAETERLFAAAGIDVPRDLRDHVSIEFDNELSRGADPGPKEAAEIEAALGRAGYPGFEPRPAPG
ncbi:MAG: sulfotransferase family protein [Acidimicrobiales bacterium]